MTNEMFEKTMKIMVRLICSLLVLLAILLVVLIAATVSASNVAQAASTANNGKTAVSLRSEELAPSKPIAPMEEIPENVPETTVKEEKWYTEEELDLLARLIYFEARGECYEGQVAVGAVVLNRVRSSSFPNTISGVIYQSGAFNVVSDGQINLTPNSTAKKAAQDALNGWDPSYGAIYYFNPSTATNKWIWSRPMTVTIGKHRFCK